MCRRLFILIFRPWVCNRGTAPRIRSAGGSACRRSSAPPSGARPSRKRAKRRKTACRVPSEAPSCHKRIRCKSRCWPKGLFRCCARSKAQCRSFRRSDTAAVRAACPFRLKAARRNRGKLHSADPISYRPRDRGRKSVCCRRRPLRRAFWSGKPSALPRPPSSGHEL